MGEFDLIERHFKQPARRLGGGAGSSDRHAVRLGIGDDCALLQPAPRMQLAVSTDMLVEGRHFFPDVDPEALGHKALAVNLSDLAACGARPLAFTLALSLPHADEAWLAALSRGMLALAAEHGCALIGGDTTRGPLNLCITVFGEVPSAAAGEDGMGQALLRSGARAGDDLYVSGHLGDARLALDTLLGRCDLASFWPPTRTDQVLTEARQRLERPTPRVALGLALRGVASAAIDVSDGLLGDLSHVLLASGVGACVEVDIATDLLAVRGHHSPKPNAFDLEHGLTNLRQWVLAGGDDYELAFTAAPAQRDTVQRAAQAAHTPVTRIGRIEAAPGLRLVDAQGQPVANTFASFDHFRAP